MRDHPSPHRSIETGDFVIVLYYSQSKDQSQNMSTPASAKATRPPRAAPMFVTAAAAPAVTILVAVELPDDDVVVNSASADELNAVDDDDDETVVVVVTVDVDDDVVVPPAVVLMIMVRVLVGEVTVTVDVESPVVSKLVPVEKSVVSEAADEEVELSWWW